VLVNFWGTWCEPCVAEFPQIVELAGTYHDDGLAVYFVSVDWLEEAGRVKEFLIAHGVQGVSYIKDEKDNPFINAINTEWSGAVPFTAMYGRSNGELTDYWEGAASREKFVAAIEAALEN
jgi:thiol-disulfide isomerase/thioredoxin